MHGLSRVVKGKYRLSSYHICLCISISHLITYFFVLHVPYLQNGLTKTYCYYYFKFMMGYVGCDDFDN